MGGLKRVQTEAEFAAILRTERAILFFWVPWEIQARQAQRVVEAWLRDCNPPVHVHRVEPDDQAFVVQWLAEQGKEQLSRNAEGVSQPSWWFCPGCRPG
jgi:hypothetical protein